jgi:hypothetical protein
MPQPAVSVKGYLSQMAGKGYKGKPYRKLPHYQRIFLQQILDVQ